MVGVGFFSKVEMRSDGVLEEMDEQVSEQDEESGIRATQFDALGTISTSAVASMKARAQRDEVAKVGAYPNFAGR